MNVGSLFSGIAGIERGFEQEGFKTAWFVENNPFCQEVLKKNFPGVPIYDDVTTIDWSAVAPVDVLTGGPPCQDISVAGRGAGIIKGTRSSLWKHYAEAIRILRPKFAVVENVPALTNRGLWVVLGNLAEIGYDAEWTTLSAREVGAPHRRERIFIIAYPHSEGSDGLAYSGECGCVDGKCEEHSAEVGEQAQSEFESCGDVVAYSDAGLCESKVKTVQSGGDAVEFVSAEVSDSSGAGQLRTEQLENDCGCERGREISDDTNQENQVRSKNISDSSMSGLEGGIDQARSVAGCGWWEVEPPLGRLAYGISRGMDNYIWREQIKALGNAVVPQVAQEIAKIVKEKARCL